MRGFVHRQQRSHAWPLSAACPTKTAAGFRAREHQRQLRPSGWMQPRLLSSPCSVFPRNLLKNTMISTSGRQNPAKTPSHPKYRPDIDSWRRRRFEPSHRRSGEPDLTIENSVVARSCPGFEWLSAALLLKMAQKAVGANSPRDPSNGRHDDFHGRLNKCRAGDLRLWGEHAHRARHLRERYPRAVLT